MISRQQCSHITGLDRGAPQLLTQAEMATVQNDATTGYLHIDRIDQSGKLIDRMHVGQASHGHLGCNCHGR